jgi:hypothetical protein
VGLDTDEEMREELTLTHLGEIGELCGLVILVLILPL